MDEQVYVGGLYLAAHGCGRSFMECNRRRMWKSLGLLLVVVLWDEGARLLLPCFAACALLAVLQRCHTKIVGGDRGPVEFFFVPTTV